MTTRLLNGAHYFGVVTKKSGRIAALIDKFQGQELDAHYLAYFDCFNRQLFYEAHEALEELWLADRHGPNGAFYKGLIQLAGAFVHLQKGRLAPAAALFKLAGSNLGRHASPHEQLNVTSVLELIGNWLRCLEGRSFTANPLKPGNAPQLRLEHTAAPGQVRKWPTAAMVKFVKLGDKVLKALGLGG